MGVGNGGEAGGMALHTKMLLGFAVGAVAGGLAFSLALFALIVDRLER